MANIVTLQQVKTHLRYPNPSSPSDDDAAFQIFMNAADEVIEFECDDILPKLFDESYDGGNCTLFLRHRPVYEVLNVEEGWGWVNYELDFVEVNSVPQISSMFAYSIDNPEVSQISRRSAGNILIPFRPGQGNIQVQYRAGEKDIPGAITLAVLELIAHWWQNSQLRSMTQASVNIGYDAVAGELYSRDTESGTQTLNIGVPYRILELIKSQRHMPIIA